MTAESVSSYGDFIQEAFIDPIRSVLIIDDEYPTIEHFLTNLIDGKNQNDYTNPDQILNVIKGFRYANPALIVDIHDGSKDEKEELAKHLHQSDLLILDYELNDKGEKSVEITKSIFSNLHFNLIIVHTNAEPQQPFEKHLLALLKVCENLQKEQWKQRVSRGKEKIEEAGDTDSRIDQKVKKSVGFTQYINFRHPGNKCSLQAVNRGDPPFGDFKAICETMRWQKSTPTEIFLWAIQQYEVANADSFGDGTAIAENWSLVSNERLWVRTSKGYITFIKKSDGINLLKELRISLEDWNPSPSRLMSAKLRSELDDQGVIAEDQALENKLLHAKFYKDLFNNDSDESRRVAIDAQIGRQLEDMGNVVKTNVMPFMTRLVESDKAAGSDSDFINNYGVDISGEKNKGAINKFNAYISCYPEINGWHLSPGHILDINDEKWVCLSPACDLVPGQKTSIGIYGYVGSGKPFLAVKLHKNNKRLDSNKINSNNFLFLPANAGDVEQYSFYEGSGTDPNKSLSPHWSLFVAENGGKFDPQENKIRISKIDCKEQEIEDAVEESIGLHFEHFQCEIVAQLRYEYALNLIQKLGAEQTRVGLGYVST